MVVVKATMQVLIHKQEPQIQAEAVEVLVVLQVLQVLVAQVAPVTVA
jgi:hypothetical protein